MASKYPKSTIEWTDNDLDAHNVITTSLPPDKFFPAPHQSLNHIDPAVISLPVSAESHKRLDFSVKAGHFFGYLNLATHSEENFGKSYVVYFVHNLLELLNIKESMQGVAEVLYEDMPFTFSGDTNHRAQADACLIRIIARESSILLIFVNGPKALVIATAIAAFQYNNRARRQLGLDPIAIHRGDNDEKKYIIDFVESLLELAAAPGL